MLKHSIAMFSLAISAAFITDAGTSPEACRVEMARYAGTPREFGKSFGQATMQAPDVTPLSHGI